MTKRHWIVEGNQLLGKIKNWFILLTFLIVVANPVMMLYKAIVGDKIIFTFRTNYPMTYLNPPGDGRHINFVKILLNDSLSKTPIGVDINDGGFSFGYSVDSTIDDWLEKAKSNSIEFPIIIKSEYVFNGRQIDNQSEYVVKRYSDKNQTTIRYIGKRASNLEKKVSLSYLYKCSN
jgi:hypothetical protein